MDEKNLQPVKVRCDKAGAPTAILWQGREYPVEVLAAQRDVYRKKGRIGVRYTVSVRGQQRVIFHSPFPRPELWVLEVRPRVLGVKVGARHCCVDLRWK